MKLFVVYVGGGTHNSNTELHDVRFSIGETIEDCYDDLRNQWWGKAESLHLDCWGTLEYADGYDITISPKVYMGIEKLYFINLGGYNSSEFTELHKNIFVVAETESHAKIKVTIQRN
jgi:hypothetical protein